jgi:hypothetical protein
MSMLVLLAASAGAQLDILTPRDAVQIVARVPDVADARQRGLCPRFDAVYGYATDVGVQVRSGCGPTAGQLIDNYVVDLRSGVVTELNSKVPVRNPEGDALAGAMLKTAAASILSPEEARCLALEAARSLPGWGGSGRSVSVDQSGPFALRFHARLRAQDPLLTEERDLAVDRATAHVRDDYTGMEVVSPGLAALASKMLALRLPPLLSDQDALYIARQTPEIQAQALKPCSVFSVGEPPSWEGIYVGVQSHCEGSQDESHTVVVIDPKTGAVTGPDGRSQLVSGAAQRAARERLEELERDRRSTRESLDSACQLK